MFLIDREIQELIEGGVVQGGPEPLRDSFSKDAAAQPCSLDLTVGSIYVPGADGEGPLTEHVLNPGGTAVIVTAEEFRLPSDIAGIGFPPTGISSKGILMTDPGHLDPGYRGTLSFTLVNVGGRPFALRSGLRICTFLLFRLSASPERDWIARLPAEAAPDGKSDERVPELLRQLAPDFLAVEERARKVAKDETRKRRFWQVWVPVAGLILAGLTAIVGGVAALKTLDGDIKRVDERVNVAGFETRLEHLEAELADPSREAQPASAAPTGGDTEDSAPPDSPSATR